MKQFLLFVLALVASNFAVAQTLQPSFTPGKQVAPTTVTQFHLPTVQPASEAKMLTDTVFPTALSLDCAEASIPTAQGGGFVFGTNSFFDAEKIQRITLEEEVDVTVTGVRVFLLADAAVADKPIVVHIYSELDADGNLAPSLGTSDTLLVSETSAYDTSTAFTTFTFAEPVALGEVSSFLVSVDIFGVYFDEAGEPDTLGNVVIVSTPVGCGDGTNVLEIFPVEGGFSFNDVFTNWQGLNAEMYVGAIIERDFFSSTRPENADFNASAFPNPVAGQLNVSFDAPTTGDYEVRVVSSAGAVISQQQVGAVRGANQATIDVANLPTGVYLFQVAGASGVQTGRFVKQ